jgi:hypothetical protein
MSEVGLGGTEGSRFELRPRPAVPSLAAAAVGTLAGCGALIIWGRGNAGTVFLVLGIGLLLFGLSLAASVLLVLARLRAYVELDPEKITIRRGSQARTLRWTEIERVLLDGPRLTLQAKEPQQDAVVINPRPAADPGFMSLVAAISQRLDTSRGYGSH